MWPGSDHDNDRLDRVIDDIARQMTEGAPSSDLKAHVLSRLEEPDASSWPRRFAWVAAPVAAAAVILLVVFLRLHQGTAGGADNVKPQPSVARAPDRPLAPAPPREAVPSTARTDSSPAATVARTRATTSPRTSRSPSDIESMAPSRLEVSSIEVPSLAISDIATTSIAVQPLEAITPM